MNHKEDQIQINVANYLRYQYPKALWFHPPNGGFRNPREGARFKQMGVLAGVSDILIFEQKQGYNGLAIELKAEGGKVQPSQTEFINKLKCRNWNVQICYGFDEAKKTIDSYFAN